MKLYSNLDILLNDLCCQTYVFIKFIICRSLISRILSYKNFHIYHILILIIYNVIFFSKIIFKINFIFINVKIIINKFIKI